MKNSGFRAYRASRKSYQTATRPVDAFAVLLFLRWKIHFFPHFFIFHPSHPAPGHSPDAGCTRQGIYHNLFYILLRSHEMLFCFTRTRRRHQNCIHPQSKDFFSSNGCTHLNFVIGYPFLIAMYVCVPIVQMLFAPRCVCLTYLYERKVPSRTVPRCGRLRSSRGPRADGVPINRENYYILCIPVRTRRRYKNISYYNNDIVP